jgi:hypothetical protein
MPYLDCPRCRLTVYSAARHSTIDECPRCSTTLGGTRTLFTDRPPRFRSPEVAAAVRTARSLGDREGTPAH